MHWRVRLILAALLFSPLLAAEKLESPSAQLRSHSTVVVVGVVEQTTLQGVLTLQQVELLHGEYDAVTALRLRAPQSLDSHLMPGDRVLVAFSPFRRNPLRSELTIIDPDGPKLLYSPGLEPAVFRNDQHTRSRLLNAAGVPRSPKLHEILTALTDADQQWQNYYANDLALRPRLWPQLDSDALVRLGQFLGDHDASATARAALFNVAAAFPSTDSTWWHHAAGRVVAEQSLQAACNPDSGAANLVRTVFIELATAKIAINDHDLARWVTCEQSALAENALLAARRLIPEREDALINEALQRTLLPASVRLFLLDHQRRLKIMREAMAREQSRPPD